MNKVLSTLVFMTLAFGAFGQVPTTTTADKLAAAKANVTTSGSTATPAAASAAPSKTVDLATPSAVETMYATFSDSLSQYGYATFTTPVTSSLPRGRTPEPYLLGPGDQLTVLLWGDPVDLGELTPQYTTTVAGDGTFFFPPVGQVRADGVLRADAEKTLVTGLAKKYKRFDLRLQVTPQRVFPLTVTGLVGQPGIVMVDPWTSLSEVLAQAGGVEKNGTLRNLKLVKADGREVAVDLYDLLIRARKPLAKIEEGDVLWVGPIGRTVAVFGDVKVPGIFEVKPNETLADVMAFAGGPLVSATGAPLTRVTWTGEAWLQSTVAWTPGTQDAFQVQDGDVYTVRATQAVKSSAEKPGFVQVTGEVTTPGFLPWTPGMTMAQALAAAGGALPSASVAGATLTRDHIASLQRKQINQALSNNADQVTAITAKLAKATDPVVLAALNQELTARIETASLLTASLTNGSLGRVQIDDPTGEKVVVQPGDAIVVPKEDGTILLFGEVYNPGAQIWRKGMTVRNAIDAVGGVTANGNWDGVYVVRANGRVESVSARGNFLGLSSLWGEALRPGDMIYVPTKSADVSQNWALAKDVISVIAQSTTTVTNVFVMLKTLGLL